MSQVSVLTTLIEPAVKALGFELWGLDYLPSGRHSVLRVYIDHSDYKKGINIEDCEQVSRQISAILEVEEPISGEYVLEVSSPGLDREFFKPSQYVNFCGQMIFIKLTSPIHTLGSGSGGSRNLKGILKEVFLEGSVFEQKLILELSHNLNKNENKNLGKKENKNKENKENKEEIFLQEILFSNIQKAQLVPNF